MKKWCKHIGWSIFVIGHGYSTEIQSATFEVPESWKLCPICGILRPGLIHDKNGKITKPKKPRK